MQVCLYRQSIFHVYFIFLEYQAHDSNKYLDGILAFMVFICAFEKNDDLAAVY